MGSASIRHRNSVLAKCCNTYASPALPYDLIYYWTIISPEPREIVMMNRSKFLVCLVLLSAVSINAHAFTFKFNRAELQQYVQDYFPFSQQTPFSRVIYSNPNVVLDEQSNRIGIEVTVRAEMPGMMPLAGRGQIDGRLEYRRETHQFYLHEPQISKVRFANAEHQLTGTVQQMINSVSQQSLPLIFVYELKDSDLREKMARSVLKNVRVRQGTLIVDTELSF